MSTGTLRRHYRQTSGAPKRALGAARPVVEQKKGNAELDEALAKVAKLEGANKALIEQARRWKAEAVALGYEPAKSENADEGAAQEQPEGDEANADTTETSGETIPETPARSAKTIEWVEYAEANPTDPPIDLEPRKGLRDEIAAHYLGEA